jgi:hypothetical protein
VSISSAFICDNIQAKSLARQANLTSHLRTPLQKLFDAKPKTTVLDMAPDMSMMNMHMDLASELLWHRHYSGQCESRRFCLGCASQRHAYNAVSPMKAFKTFMLDYWMLVRVAGAGWLDSQLYVCTVQLAPRINPSTHIFSSLNSARARTRLLVGGWAHLPAAKSCQHSLGHRDSKSGDKPF